MDWQEPPRLERVSIHTRHYWRVKQNGGVVLHQHAAVSIHTRHYWRVKHQRAKTMRQIAEVSIHTRHYWRVKHGYLGLRYGSDVFQSTPAITGG